MKDINFLKKKFLSEIILCITTSPTYSELHRVSMNKVKIRNESCLCLVNLQGHCRIISHMQKVNTVCYMFILFESGVKFLSCRTLPCSVVT
jgi:hypothetical protein